MNRCHALIPCGGSGQRLGGDIPKQYRILFDRPMVHFGIQAFLKSQRIDSVWVGVSSQDPYLEGGQFQWPSSSKLRVEKTGGQTRHETVLNTLGAMLAEGYSPEDWVLVHDAARPGVLTSQIDELIRVVTKYPHYRGGLLAIPVADTIKTQVPSDFHLTFQSEGGISRDGLWLAQTPQMFRLGELKAALNKALQEKELLTDEASAFERIGLHPFLVPGSVENFKVTYEQDFLLMEKLLKMNFAQTLSPMYRIGQGYDIHRLVEGRPLILGGVTIPHEQGLLGHSDGDALLHAITDALLGSVGLGDIGKHFPDWDPNYKDSDSKLLLRLAYEKVQETGYKIGNIDSTIICQAPKLADHIPRMVETIAHTLSISRSLISIKAKTNEGLGYLGEGQAIATQAVTFMVPNV